VRETDEFAIVAMLPPCGAALLNVTLCAVPAKFHVTVPPAVIVTSDGSNCRPVVAFTLAVEPGVDTVTLTVCDLVVLPTVPFTAIVVVPTATPVTTPAEVTVAMDGLFDWNVVESPLMAALFWSRATTVRFCVP
jgi:hypothetical protein